MPDTTSGVQIGDAVVSFVADMTQLDKGVDSIGPRVQAGMAGATAATAIFGEELDATGENAENAGEVIKDAMQKATYSTREARGEAMLLGEAFGVHLPRHVTSFIATIPGVGEALSAAFAATAVLFIIEAVVKLTEKVTDFISTTYIYTDAMRQSDEAIKEFNKELTRHHDAMTGLQKTYDEVGMTAQQKFLKSITDINKSVEDQVTALEKLKNEAVSVATAQGGMWDSIKNYALGAADKIMGTHLLEAKLTQESTDAVKKAEDDKALAVKQAEDKIAEDRLKAAALEKERQLQLKKLREDNAFEYWQDMNNATDKLIEDGMKLQKAYEQNLADIGKAFKALNEDGGADALQSNPMVKMFLNARDAAHQFGIELKSDLIVQVHEMRKAFAEMAASGLDTNTTQMKAFAIQISDLQKRIDTFGADATPKVRAFFDAFKQGGQQSEAAMWGFGDAYGQAIGKVIAGEEGLGHAMEAATKQFIMQIGSRALVQGMFYLAQGIADTFWNPARAGADFAAAGEFLALGAVATGAGAAIPGGGSSGGSGGGYSGTGTSGNVTSGAGTAPGPQTTTTRLAGGGLVTSPISTIIGDSPSGGSANEAVLPLDNPEVMAKIAGTIAAHIGGGSGNTINHTSFGQLKHSDLKRLMKQISQTVNKGTGTLNSTKTGRIIKRSA